MLRINQRAFKKTDPGCPGEWSSKGLGNLHTWKAPGDANAACWSVGRTGVDHRTHSTGLQGGRKCPSSHWEVTILLRLFFFQSKSLDPGVVNSGYPQPPEGAGIAVPANWWEIKILGPIPEPHNLRNSRVRAPTSGLYEAPRVIPQHVKVGEWLL